MISFEWIERGQNGSSCLFKLYSKVVFVGAPIALLRLLLIIGVHFNCWCVNEAVLTCTHNLYFNQKSEKVTIFHLKNCHFYNCKNCRRVIVIIKEQLGICMILDKRKRFLYIVFVYLGFKALLHIPGQMERGHLSLAHFPR